MELVDISEDQLDYRSLLDRDHKKVSGLNDRIAARFPGRNLIRCVRVLLLDLSQFFSSHSDQLNELIEAPLG